MNIWRKKAPRNEHGTYRQNLDKAGYVITAIVHALQGLQVLGALQQLAKVGLPQATQVRLAPLVHQDVLQHKAATLITYARPCTVGNDISKADDATYCILGVPRQRK